MAKGIKKATVVNEIIVSKIYYIRKQRIMLDRDLAELYGVQAIRLREQVKRNVGRFPSNFMFRLTSKEVETMVSQNAIPSKQQLGGFLPYAFTEHGVLMLASVLKSEQALNVSVRIIEIFVKMREMLSTNKDILMEMAKIEKKLTAHDTDIRLIFEALKQLLNPPLEKRKRIGFKPDD
ncbi:MAG: ORF6N domain-containing protein [Bacteroidota bacterium]|nr:ORF6N domain-containing protein [Bacteroidota bacterium]